MKFKFETLLAKNGIQDSELSTGLKKKVTTFRRVLAGVADAEKLLKDNNLTVKKREELTGQLEDSKTFLTETDDELVEKITAWIPKREANAAAGERLKAAKASKAGAGPAAPAAAATSTATAPTGSHTPTKKPEPATPAEPEKKGWGGWGWVLGAAATIGLAFLGLQVYRGNLMKNNP